MSRGHPSNVRSVAGRNVVVVEIVPSSSKVTVTVWSPSGDETATSNPRPPASDWKASTPSPPGENASLHAMRAPPAHSLINHNEEGVFQRMAPTLVLDHIQLFCRCQQLLPLRNMPHRCHVTLLVISRRRPRHPSKRLAGDQAAHCLGPSR